MRQPYGVGWRLDRPRFDALLRAAVAEAGGHHMHAARAVALGRRRDGAWEVTIATEGRYREVQADILVDASGRARWVARGCGVRTERYDRLVGLVGVFGSCLAGAEAGTEVGEPTLVEAVVDGWWYAASLPDGRLVVAYLSDRDLIAADWRLPDGWLALLGRTMHIRERVARQGSALEQGPRPVCARTSCLEMAVGDGWCAVGDAATAHDPLSSLGITAAVATGMRAAEAISRRGQGTLEEYARWVRHGYARYLADWLGYYAAEQRWPTSPFWQRRHAVWRRLLRV